MRGDSSFGESEDGGLIMVVVVGWTEQSGDTGLFILVQSWVQDDSALASRQVGGIGTCPR